MISSENLWKEIDELFELIQQDAGKNEILQKIKDLVPEYTPDELSSASVLNLR